MPMPSATDHASIAAGIGVSDEMTSAMIAPKIVPMTPPNDRQHDRLGEHLRHDVRAPRAERLAQPDLARALGDDHQHDVHDHDAADDERQPDDADQHGEDAARGAAVEVENRVRREQAEVVRLLRLEAPRRRAAPPSHRPSAGAISATSRGFTITSSDRREPNIIWNCAERDDRELVLRLAEQRAALRADADDAEVDALDLDDLVERIGVGAEQPVGASASRSR